MRRFRDHAHPMSVKLIQCIAHGDSAKGKVSEFIIAQAEKAGRKIYNARGTGGDNAGHTVISGTRKAGLSLLPAGCIHENAQLVLGRGMVLHMPALMDEDIKTVNETFGVDPIPRLIIDSRAHIIFLAHRKADAKDEERLGEKKIGSTKKGIAQAYADKHARKGMRMEWLLKDPASIKDHYRNVLIHGWAERFGIALTDEEQQKEISDLLRAKEMLEANIRSGKDMRKLWRRAKDEDTDIVIEGAQGSLLSIDCDEYPNVTSSPSTTAGAMQGLGIPVRELNEVIATMKAYETAVGTHVLRTQFPAEQEARIQENGNEFGTRTGRRRKCTPMDLEISAEIASEESVTSIAFMKGDVLDPEEIIPVGVGTKADGTVEYVNHTGWMSKTRGMTDYADMPGQAKALHRLVEDHMGLPIRYVGTGPESSEMIDRTNI